MTTAEPAPKQQPLTRNGWTASTDTLVETLDPWRAAALHATLDAPGRQPAAGSELPPLWHWLYFLPLAPQADLGPDGHPHKGGFLPPVPLPRRMWAASNLRFHQPLVLGEEASKRSTVTDVTDKTGRTGTLCFVTVQHEVHGPRGLAIEETQTVVYRAAATAEDPVPAAAPAPAGATLEQDHLADQSLLFRYSALTFNAHRIHYDTPYARGDEHYPDLVVHGPLQATLMAELLRRQQPQARISGFRFQAKSPLFVDVPFLVAAKPGAGSAGLDAWVQTAAGGLTMQGAFTLA